MACTLHVENKIRTNIMSMIDFRMQFFSFSSYKISYKYKFNFISFYDNNFNFI